MGNYTITATITFEVTNPSAVRAIAALAGSNSEDERVRIEAVLRSGMRELPKVADHYGYVISASDARLEDDLLSRSPGTPSPGSAAPSS